MNLFEELRWRGMIHNENALVPGTADFLSSEKTVGYIGFDPTGDSLHIGSLATIMMIVHLQRAGHKPIALVGGATGMIGDPSGKDKERQLLTIETIQHNVDCIQKQLAHYLDFEGVDNPAEMVNNYDWFKNMGFLDFLRDVGKHVTINYMMAKESVKKRIETGLSYTEFAYQLVQGYDYVWLYENKGVRLQMGGADQWGNIISGVELVRRKLGHEAKVYAITCPLITREDGSKFGKTADGNSVWLDPKKTSPYEFYQYWLNINDTDLDRYLKVFTLKNQEEIAELVAQQEAEPYLNIGKKALAEDVTARLHGAEALENAKILTNFFFARKIGPKDLEAIKPEVWDEIASNSTETKSFSVDRLKAGINVMDLLAELQITKSKGEARRAIQSNGSVSVNGVKCESIELELDIADAFYEKYMFLQNGKKNKYIVALNK